jgi:hypothetical protein
MSIVQRSTTSGSRAAHSMRVMPGVSVPAWRPGARHEFRVRLVDLSGGGPESDDVSPEAYSSHPA